jgi:DNA replication and repair protein RecF
MFLKDLQLLNFRNYKSQSVKFKAQKAILLGNNAQGKSNLLESVELLATLKSHRTSRDRDLVLDGEDFARVKATLARQFSVNELEIALRAKGRRSLKLNRETLRRHLDFLGTLNAVQFSCLDLELVRGSPESRRSWLDTLLMQLEPVYANILVQYHQILRQRNALLKSFRKQQEGGLKEGAASPDALLLWDRQLAEAGTRVIRRRSRGLERLAPLAQTWHAEISGQEETLSMRYLPNVSCDRDDPESIQRVFLEKIVQRRPAEYNLGTTVVGPHRDDIEFTIDETPAKSYGSQGQQRTLVLALKLAELNLIEEIVGDSPLLLLDDVLAELDLTRQNQLLEVIQDRFQTLITTTHLNAFDAQWLKSSQILTVEAGKILEFGDNNV